MSHGNRAWIVVGVAAAMAGAEWLHSPVPFWAWGVTLGAAAGALLALRDGRRGVLPAVLLAALATLLVVTQRRVERINNSWPAEREARIVEYGERVGGKLRHALATTTALAERGARVAHAPTPRAFAALADALPDPELETAVAVLDSVGAPIAWAGRHRLAPNAVGDSIAARSSGYYVILETRRHVGDRTVVASVLIWADPIVVDGDRSVAERFRRNTEVGLLVYPPAAATGANPDIFDYAEPTTAGPRLLFSVQPVPPTQAAAREHVLVEGKRAVLALLILLLVTVAYAAPAGARRLLVLLAFLWLAVRADISTVLDVGPGVWPTWLMAPTGTDASPFTLAVAGVLVTALAAALWWRPPSARSPALGALGALLLLLGGGLAWRLGATARIPAGGMAAEYWIVWLVAVIALTAAFAVAGVGLIRRAQRHLPDWSAAAVLTVSAIGAVLLVSQWTPADQWGWGVAGGLSVGAVMCGLATRRTVALVAVLALMSTEASLALWQSGTVDRVRRADADLSDLSSGDVPPESLLHELADSAAAAPVTISAARLYALYQSSAFARSGYPAMLAMWNATDGITSRVALDSLAVSDDLLQSIAERLPDEVGSREIHTVPAVPGAERVLALRVAPGVVILAVAGPRTALVVPDRLGRLLSSAPRRAPFYRLALGSPSSLAPASSWVREGALLRTTRTIEFSSGVRDVQATIRLLPVTGLLVRGILLAGLALLLAGVLWLIVRSLAGHGPVLRGWERTTRSFRLRLALALSAFFVVPSIAFALWSFSHFGSEAERGRDLLIGQTLRDAVQVGGELLRTPGAPLDRALRGLSERVNADLALYRGGSLIAASAPVLSDLGIIPPLMDAQAFQSIALGGALEVTRAGPIPSVAERVGFRLVEFGPPGGIGILSTPQAGTEWESREQQRELAYVLLLATLMGISAAIVGARLASRALSRPVSELRRAAIAVGQGKPTPLPSRAAPMEFEPVFGAFQRMASDVRASQVALDQARRRTATVLATVGTGVIAIDPTAHVILANPRACELLNVPLAEGDELLDRMQGELEPVGLAVRQILEDPSIQHGELEFTIDDRRLALQSAPLGVELSGVVLALNDVTDVSRAERVLAWGEMARQVAHEIKNPLTPMRLGIQHLRRVYERGDNDFSGVLGETSDRILVEIDRLDTIARAFSRFAAPSADPASLERVDLGAVAEEVTKLYGLAGEGATVTLERRGHSAGAARADEVKEVLVNLLENARNAAATRIRVVVSGRSFAVHDDGEGIASDLLAQVFEPRFSTTTSGSGLGLAIVKRLVESWGGTVVVSSTAGEGTIVRVETGAPPPA